MNNKERFLLTTNNNIFIEHNMTKILFKNRCIKKHLKRKSVGQDIKDTENGWEKVNKKMLIFMFSCPNVIDTFELEFKQTQISVN